MLKIIIKILIGCIIGIILFLTIVPDDHRGLLYFLLCVIWSIGIVFGLKKGLHVLQSIIDSTFKISIIFWLSIGTGIIGLLLLILAIVLMLGLGWIYGYYALYLDWKSYKTGI